MEKQNTITVESLVPDRQSTLKIPAQVTLRRINPVTVRIDGLPKIAGANFDHWKWRDTKSLKKRIAALPQGKRAIDAGKFDLSSFDCEIFWEQFPNFFWVEHYPKNGEFYPTSESVLACTGPLGRCPFESSFKQADMRVYVPCGWVRIVIELFENGIIGFKNPTHCILSNGREVGFQRAAEFGMGADPYRKTIAGLWLEKLQCEPPDPALN